MRLTYLVLAFHTLAILLVSAQTRTPSLGQCESFPLIVSLSNRVLLGSAISNGVGSSLFTIGGTPIAGFAAEGIFATFDDATPLVLLERRTGVSPRITAVNRYPLEKGGPPTYSGESSQVDTMVGDTGYTSRLKGALVCSVPNTTAVLTCGWPSGVGSGYESWQDEYLDVFVLVSPSLTLLDGACNIPTLYSEAAGSTALPTTPIVTTVGGITRSQLSSDTIRMYVGSIVIQATPMSYWFYLCLRVGLVVSLIAGMIAFLLYGDVSLVDLTIAVVLLDQVCATTTDHAHVAYARYLFRPLSGGLMDTHLEIISYSGVLVALLLLGVALFAFCYFTSLPPRRMEEELEGPISKYFRAAASSHCPVIIFGPSLVLLPGMTSATCELFTALVGHTSFSGVGGAQVLALCLGPLYCLTVLISVALICHNCGGVSFATAEASDSLKAAIPGMTKLPPLSAVLLQSPWYVRYLHPIAPNQPRQKNPLSLKTAARMVRLFKVRKKPPQSFDQDGNSVGGSSDRDDGPVNPGGEASMYIRRRKNSLAVGETATPLRLSPQAAALSPPPSLVTSPSEVDAGLVNSPSIDHIILVDSPIQRGPTATELDPFESIKRAATLHQDVVRPAPQPPRVQDPDDLCGISGRNIASIAGVDIRPTLLKHLFYPLSHWSGGRYRTAFSFLIKGASSTSQLRWLAPVLPHFTAVCVTVCAFSGPTSCSSRSYVNVGVVGLYLLLTCLIRPFRYRFAACCGIASGVLLAAMVGLASFSTHALPVTAGIQLGKDVLLFLLLIVCLLRSIHIVTINLFVESGVEVLLEGRWNRVANKQEVVYDYHKKRSSIAAIQSVMPSSKYTGNKGEGGALQEVPSGGGPTSSEEDGGISPAASVTHPHTLFCHDGPAAEANYGSSTSLRGATLVRNMHRYQYSNPSIPDGHTLDTEYRLTADTAGCIVIVHDGSEDSMEEFDHV